MSFQFILGRAGSGKSTYLFEQIVSQVKRDPGGDPIILLVPDQMTFQAEYRFAVSSGVKGSVRFHVLSFSRLALRVMMELGGITKQPIDGTGISMLLRKIVERRKGELRLFQNALKQQGFLTHLEQMLTEFKRYCLSPLGLKQLQDEVNKLDNKHLQDKLHDLSLIYQELESTLSGVYVDGEDQLKLLEQKIPDSQFISSARIYLDGFNQLTAQELGVVKALIRHAKEVKMALTLDRPYRTLPEPISLFYSTAQTREYILKWAEDERLSIDADDLCTTAYRHQEQPELYHLEQHYGEALPSAYPGPCSALSIISAVNRRAEVEGVARQLLQIVRDQGYRYKEIAIYTRDISLYEPYIKMVFSDYQIPLFLDRKKEMLNHPLIELIRSSLDVVSYQWRYEAIFRCVKTDLLLNWLDNEELIRQHEQIDSLENYVLAHGVEGYLWKIDSRWQYRMIHQLEHDERITACEEEALSLLHEIRMRIVAPLSQLETELMAASTVQHMCLALYTFLENCQVVKKLEVWRQSALEKGRVLSVREHQQVWKAVLDLLDQLVELIGEEEVSLETFVKILDTGCQSLRFSLAPPAIDQVMIGSMEHSRFSHVKVAFVIGANDGLLPAKPKDDGLLDDKEREVISHYGVRLAPGSDAQWREEQLMIYQVLSTPSEQLLISYALADQEGKGLTPSPLIRHIQLLFPQLKERHYVLEPSQLSEEHQLTFISTPEKALSSLAVVLREWTKGEAISAIWWDVYHWLVNQKAYRYKVGLVLSSLFYRNQTSQLSKETSLNLYGPKLIASVTRMERFQSCPFAHFISHGLRLRERAYHRLEAPDIGQFFHAALNIIDQLMRIEEKEWSSLDEKDCLQLASRAVSQLAPRIQSSILLRSSRQSFMKHKLERILSHTTHMMSQHARVGAFYIKGLEIAFGSDGELPALRLPLEEGLEMEIIGRIDRVDVAENEQGLYVRIIDYKSSRTELDLSKVYHGLSLQMLTYLDVLMTHAKSWLGQKATPAGLLYFHVHLPLIQVRQPMEDSKLDKEKLKAYKMKGLVLADKEVVQLMDTSLNSSHSEVIPVALTKDGGFYASSSVAQPEQFDQLRQYVRQKIRDIGMKIMSGETMIQPVRLKQELACTHCSYRAVCHFDPELEENRYNDLIHLPKQTALAYMNQEDV